MSCHLLSPISDFKNSEIYKTIILRQKQFILCNKFLIFNVKF